MSQPYKLGAVPSKPDSRDFVAQIVKPQAATQLPKVYTVPLHPPVRNQQNEGTCVGHALAGILDYHQLRLNFKRELSVRDAYEGARKVEPVEGEGAMPRAALKNAQRSGLCHEVDWPYIPHNPGQPGSAAPHNRLLNKSGAYAQIPLNTLNIKSAILQYGPLLAVVPVTDGFWTPDSNGFVYYTNPVRGYHAVVLVGYDDDRKAFLLRNSWGPDWGKDGHCWLPYHYMITECWTVTANILAELPSEPPKPDFWTWLRSLLRI